MPNNDVQTHHRKLFEKIVSRGPNAYNDFVNILEESFPNAFAILQNENNGNNFNQDNLNCAYSQSDILLRACWPFGGAAANSDNDDDDEYAMPNAIIELREYTERLPAVNFTVIKSDKIHYSIATSTYRMESKFRGVAFIANIINFRNKEPRRGAEVDRNNLVTLLREMGYTIFYYEDLTKNVRHE